MNIRLMRHIDYWLGIPLCCALSFFNYVFKIMRLRPRREDKPRRILFIKLSELGAIVLSYPLLRRIKDRHPEAELFFVTFSRNKGIFKALGIIPEAGVFLIDDTSLRSFIFDTLKVIMELRRIKIDVVFDLEFFSRFSAVLAYLTGSRKSIGFYRYSFEGLYRGHFLTHRVQYNPLSHISRNYLSLALAMDSREKSSPELGSKIGGEETVFPAYISRKEIKDALLEKLRHSGIDTAGGKSPCSARGRLFLVNPGEGVLPAREWPLEYFISLCRRILVDETSRIILVGTEGASRKAGLVPWAIKSQRCVNLSGKTSLEELFELFCMADALISNDCGLAHLAMLAPIKKIIIFGPESPRVFAPPGPNSRIIYSDWPCSPCLSVLNHRVSLCRDNLCLKAVKPEEVYAAISSFL